MRKIISNRRIVEDGWRLLDADALLAPGEDGLIPDLPCGDVIAPLGLWRLRRDELIGRAGRRGVLLAADDAPEAVAPDLALLDLVAVRFDRFSSRARETSGATSCRSWSAPASTRSSCATRRARTPRSPHSTRSGFSCRLFAAARARPRRPRARRTTGATTRRSKGRGSASAPRRTGPSRARGR